MSRRLFIVRLMVLGLLLGWGTALGQPSKPEPQQVLPNQPSRAPSQWLQPETLGARRTALQAQIDLLTQSKLTKEELAQARAPYDETLKWLTALEDAWQRQTLYTTQLAQLPERIKAAEDSLKTLKTHVPGRFSTVTEALRDQYNVRLQATQADILALQQQTPTGEARLVTIPKELEARAIERSQIERRLAEIRETGSLENADLSAVSDAIQLAIRLQGLEADMLALEAERQWLAHRGSLNDTLLKTNQIRFDQLQQELGTIRQMLGTTLEQQQENLRRTHMQLGLALRDASQPIERLSLSIQLATVRTQQAITMYRQQLNEVSDQVVTEEKRKTTLQQHINRLTSLFEKEAGSSGAGQRALVAFEQLRRERDRFQTTSVNEIEAHLHNLTEQMFTIEDQLYDFDQQVETQLAALATESEPLSPNQREEVNKVFDEQRAALREYHQVVALLLQKQNTLIARHHDYWRLLDDTYYSSLSKMLWRRSSEPVSWAVWRRGLEGVASTLRSVQTGHAEVRRLWQSIAGKKYQWGLFIGLFMILSWAAYTSYARLRGWVKSALASCANRHQPPGVIELLLVVLRSAVWPIYLYLVTWTLAQVVVSIVHPFALAMVQSVQLSAVILWTCLFGYDILRRDGWGEQFWELESSCRQFLRRLLIVGCLAAFVCIIPRHLVLALPKDVETATDYRALARLLLLLFQGSLLILIALAGWRQNPLMATLLARSRDREGLLWRLWPSIYGLLLAGLISIIALDVLGYRYAAQFIWLRSLESAVVLLLRRLLVILLLLRVLQRFLNYMFYHGHFKRHPAAEATIERTFRVAYVISSTLLMLLSVGAILEIWGISATWLFTSPVGLMVLTRAAVIALVIGLAFVVIQVSKTVSEYLVRPQTQTLPLDRVNPRKYIAERKFRTMVPLLQTLGKVGIMIVSTLVILEQLNVATGPILTGVGIFGLAVGFASQSLIKDVINGLFILFEDSLSVGDWVTLRDIRGEVEKVTLRAVTIRDLQGTVHVIPNGTLDMISNLTKDYGRYVLDIGVAYREDADAVMDILRAVDAEIFQDPQFRWNLIEPLDIMGVHDFADSAVVIRTRLKTRTGKQWAVAREYRRRIKKAFDEHGIEFPFPHRTLYWGTPKTGEQPPVAFHLMTSQEAVINNGINHGSPGVDRPDDGLDNVS